MLDIRAVTMVLVGGRLTLADGTQVDSRQPAEGAATAKAVRDAITSSAEWWDAVSSVVVPTLEGEDSGYALVVGARTVTRASPDGEIRRSSLKRRLAGGTGTVSIQRSGINSRLTPEDVSIATLRNWQGEHMGEVGFRADEGNARWRVLHGSDFYLRVLAGRLGAGVVVDASGGFLSHAFQGDLGSLSVEFGDRPLGIQPGVIILPDTPEVRRQVDTLLAGRVVEWSGNDAAMSPEYDPAAPRNPSEFLKFGVLRAECNVSRLLRNGQWEDGADLEAARLLLLRRFDLKLGLWDLAFNPVLRSTVLDPAPPTTAPDAQVEAPVQARERARREAEKATTKRDAARRGVRQVAIALHKELRSVGWRVDDLGGLTRPLTEPLSNWPDSPKGPLVMLRAEVTKSAIRVVVWHWLYNDLDLNAFIEGRREAFEAVAGLPPAPRDTASVTLWSADAGWGDPDVDWQHIGRAVAGRTKQWEALLAAFVTSCRDVRRARFARHRS